MTTRRQIDRDQTFDRDGNLIAEDIVEREVPVTAEERIAELEAVIDRLRDAETVADIRQAVEAVRPVERGR